MCARAAKTRLFRSKTFIEKLVVHQVGRCYNGGMKKIKSLYELKIKAMEDEAYEKLAIDTAYNLGGSNINDLNDAIRWLNINAMEASEEGVVEEVNFMME